jgi:hypothetical protein
MTIEVFTPRWGQLLNKLFTGRGGRGGAPLIVLDDILPTVPIIDAGEFEAHWARGEFPFAYGQTVGIVAAQYPVAFITNPAGSNTIIIIERVTVSGASAAGVVLGGISSTGALAGVGVVSSDMRCPGVVPGLTTGNLNTAINMTMPQFIAYAPLLGPCEELIPGPPAGFTLTPGNSFNVQLLVLAAGVDVSFTGYTRIVDPGELA